MKKIFLFILNFFKTLFGFGSKKVKGAVFINRQPVNEAKPAYDEPAQDCVESTQEAVIYGIQPEVAIETKTEVVIEKPAKAKKPRTRKKKAETTVAEVAVTPETETPAPAKKKRSSKRKKKSE
jgi:hypothetical protein